MVATRPIKAYVIPNGPGIVGPQGEQGDDGATGPQGPAGGQVYVQASEPMAAGIGDLWLDTDEDPTSTVDILAMQDDIADNATAIEQYSVSISSSFYEPAADNTTDDRAKLQDALDDAAGGTLVIKRGTYYIVGALTVAANTIITIEPGTTIRQGTKYTPVFDCLNADDVIINGNGVQLKWTGSRAYTGGSSFRGDDTYGYGAGVWSNGNRCKFHDIRAYGFTSGIYLSAWNGSSLANYSKTGNEVHNLESDTCDFGLLFGGQVAPKVRNVSGTYAQQSGSANDPHLIYVTKTGLNRAIDIDGGNCTGGTVGVPYQFKGVDGGKAVNLLARSCPGLFTFELCINGFKAQGINSANTASGENQQAVGYIDDSSKRTVVEVDSYEDDAGTGCRLVTLNGTDNKVTIRARTRQTTTVDNYHANISGTRNHLDIDLVNIANDGSDLTTGRRLVDVDAGSKHTVKVRRARNIKGVGDVTASVTDCTVDLDSRYVTLIPSGMMVPSFNFNEPTTRYLRNGVYTVTNPTSGQNIAPDLSQYSLIVVQVGNSNNFSMDGYYGTLNRGEPVQIQIVRNTASMGTVTWYTGTVAGSWNLRSAWSNPANGFTAIVNFVWNGTQMLEVNRVVV